MLYINFVYGDDDGVDCHSAPVPPEDAAYLRRCAESMRRLSDEQYMSGPAVILHTMAKYSYVLDDDVLFWCVEWDPGLLIFRFAPDGSMDWTAVRSPVPNFGGRQAEESEWEDYDPDAPNPQYNLIFDPWDAQFDEQLRSHGDFQPVEPATMQRFERALQHVNHLGGILQERFESDRDAWMSDCQNNLAQWAAEFSADD